MKREVRQTAGLRFGFERRLPVLLQSSAAECGLVCLAMISSYHGYVIDVVTMRRKFPLSLKGASLKGLMQIADELKLSARPLRLEIDRLSELRLPAILHWNLNHFVVLRNISRRSATIHDPLSGVRKVSLEELSAAFTGVALEVTPSSTFERKEEALQFRLAELTGRLHGLFGGLGQILVLGLGLQFISMLMPFYLQWIVDEALPSSDYNLISVLGIGFVAIVIIQNIFTATRSWVTMILSKSLNFQWLGNVFTHMLRLPLSYFEQRHLGDIVSRFGSIRSIQSAITTDMVESLIDGLLVILSLAAMFLYSSVLTSLAIVAVLIYIVLRLLVYRVLRQANAEALIKGARQETHFLESVRGVQAIRLFGREDERRQTWLNALAAQINVDIRIAKISIGYQTAHGLLFGVERIVIIWLGAIAVADARLSIGMLFAFMSFKDQFSQRVSALVDRVFDLLMLRVHADRLADMVLTPVEEERSSMMATAEVSPLADIELRNISFRYSELEPHVLDRFSLTIPAGQCIAITGASGCGKTTLIKIILGLLKPTQGEVLVGGVNIHKMGLKQFRQLTGSVMQDDQLFAGTLAENICFFDPEPDQKRVEECAQMAAIAADIGAMPMGYMTLIGDLGSGLSGGQKQRVVLARALYRAPSVLVLDEATSHLDLTNELTINNAIRRLKMTRIMVAHRADTVAMADRVILMEDGEVMFDNASEKMWKPQGEHSGS